MDFTEFWTICSMNGIILSLPQIEMLKRYTKELEYWNQKVNLLSRQDEQNILEHHILHSLSVLKYIDIPKKSKCVDVGTGGGLPGIPLAIAGSELRMLLVDSIHKKIKITNMLANHTELRHLKAICGRVENLTEFQNNFRAFDFVFARAVAKIENVIGWTHNLLKNNGKIVLYKGGDLKNEIQTAKELYDNLIVKEMKIEMKGYSWFEENEKKILICRFE